MQAKEKAQEIRKLLKAKGIKASVRCKPCTYSQSITVTIMDLSVKLEDVEKIARCYESVRRCEASGEILSGANTYLSIKHDYDTLRDARTSYIPTAEKLFSEFSRHESPNIIETVAEKDDLTFLLWPDNWGKPDQLVINTPERQRERAYCAYSVAALAEGLALIDSQYQLNLLAS